MKEITRRWFSMKAAEGVAEVSIFDEIGGWGVRVADFKKEFDAIKDSKSITLYLNSPGGDVFDGMAIYNIIAGVKDKVTVKVLGLAASIASVLALAGKKLVMGAGTYLMIHDPWAIGIGTAADMRKTAELLDSIGANMADLYTARSGYERDEVVKLMAEETWLDAAAAHEAGFADEVDESVAVAAMAGDPAKFRHAPQAVAEHMTQKPIPPATARDFEALLRDAGYTRSQAMTITAEGFTAGSDAGRSEEEDAGIASTGTDAAAPTWSDADRRALNEAELIARSLA